MKQSDIFSLILIAGIGTLAAFFICNAIMGNPDEAQTEFKVVSGVISSDLALPDPEIFNAYAINPTIEVYVGNCEDIDKNGFLDKAELIACGQEIAAEADGWTQDEIVKLKEGDGCILTADERTLCADEKRVYLDELLVRINEEKGAAAAAGIEVTEGN